MLNIIVAGIALFIFGAIWYMPLFGKLWARLNGFNMEGDPSMKGMAKPMVINFVVNLLFAYSAYYLFPQLLALNFSSFWFTMVVVWFGFSFPIYMNQYLWERKPFNLVLLNTAYGICSTTLLSLVVYYWQM